MNYIRKQLSHLSSHWTSPQWKLAWGRDKYPVSILSTVCWPGGTRASHEYQLPNSWFCLFPGLNSYFHPTDWLPNNDGDLLTSSGCSVINLKRICPIGNTLPVIHMFPSSNVNTIIKLTFKKLLNRKPTRMFQLIFFSFGPWKQPITTVLVHFLLL